MSEPFLKGKIWWAEMPRRPGVVFSLHTKNRAEAFAKYAEAKAVYEAAHDAAPKTDEQKLALEWLNKILARVREVEAENARLLEIIARKPTGTPAQREAQRQKRLEAAETESGRLREALTWYEEQVRCCRMITSQGNSARNSLDADGGKRARAALAKEGK